MDVVDKIASVKTDYRDKPLKPVKILKAELIGEEAKEPERIA